MRFPAKITSSCIWVAIPVDWVILHWYDCGADGRSVVGGRRSVYGHVITKFSGMVPFRPLGRWSFDFGADVQVLDLAWKG